MRITLRHRHVSVYDPQSIVVLGIRLELLGVYQPLCKLLMVLLPSYRSQDVSSPK